MSANSDRIKEVFSSRQYELLKKLLSREGLSEDFRLLCSLAFLQAEGDRVNLGKVLDIYIEDEGDFKRAYEVLLQGYLFCGYPKAIESFFCMNEVLAGKKGFHTAKIKPGYLVDSGELLKRGETISKKVHKDNFEKIKKKISGLCPDLGYLMIAEGYGHVLYRGGLDLKIRELAIVSSLTSLDAARQLNSHIRGARNVGCDDYEIYEAIITGMAWTENIRIKNSIELWSDITGREIPDSFDYVVYRGV
jgi:4-carboxymuconolactone decarboxylase